METPPSFSPPDIAADPGVSPKVQRVLQLFVRHRAAITAFLLSLHPNLAEVDDILQETFLVVYEKAETYCENLGFVPWACGIARFKLLAARRRAAVRLRVQLSDAAFDALCTDMPKGEFWEEHLEALGRCVEKLGPRSRQLVTLRYHERISCDTIARNLNQSHGAVRVTLARAREFLRNCIKNQLLPT